MWDDLRREIAAGHQAYVIHPVIDETEGQDLKAATAEHARLAADVFPDRRVGLLHGRLKAKEKDAVMEAFAAGEIDVLVATTVVEVGVDVPNATRLVIHNPERFGLAQLHQLRGRVGRGEGRSACWLLVDRFLGEEAWGRLHVLRRARRRLRPGRGGSAPPRAGGRLGHAAARSTRFQVGQPVAGQ